MVSEWLQNLMVEYNSISLEKKESYSSLIQMPGIIFEKLIKWALENLPDEILVGFDPNWDRPHLVEVDELFLSQKIKNSFLLVKDIFWGNRI